MPGIVDPHTSQEAERHRAKMQKRKAMQDKEVASKTVEKGLLMVNTGPGKGKSTAAFGLALRMLGYGRRVVVIQFIKGAWHTGERKALKRFDDLVEWHALGEGFTWETQDKARDIAACQRAWGIAQQAFSNPDIGLVILDELNVALRYDYLPMHQVLADIAMRPITQHVAVTGRNAKEAMLEAADLVTEMTLIKHHFKNGVKAQEGIEF
ncbi:cob(I)yrinic acid a,c-diamide adenosyltransferase [Acetobacter pomorum]|uniref:cob(I)yrinic acid a,c-diamide adenosyltransferase n=1 Tax=Acetobacter pomorum TaxID=65959 RepID=UPI001801E0D1